MPTLSRAPLSGRYLSFAEREELAILGAQDVGVRETARWLGRSPSTISRELRRNAATRGGRLEYRATTAQWHADRRAGRPKVAKLAANQRLRTMCSSGWRARSRGPTAWRCGARRSGGSVGGTGVARIAGGRTRGVRSRSRAGCGSTWGTPDLPLRLRQSAMTGWYLRVLQPGLIQAGQPLRLLARPFPHATVAAVLQARYDRLTGRNPSIIDGAELAACPALAADWRAAFARQALRYLGRDGSQQEPLAAQQRSDVEGDTCQ
jgi:hypothetical protein